MEDDGTMSSLWPDTHPDLERLQVERLRQMPAWGKMALMAEMTESVRTLALAGLRQRYPTDTPAHRHRRLADLLLCASSPCFPCFEVPIIKINLT